MRVSPGVMTFLVGLVLLAAAGMFYQQSLLSSGAYGNAGGGTTIGTSPTTKYVCPMRCVESDEPGDCPVCGMEMTTVETAPATVATGPELYTCPMHPQIIQDRPGTCPICGMELVPRESQPAGIDDATRELVNAVALSPLQTVLSNVQAVHPVQQRMALEIPAIGEVGVPQDRENKLVSWQAGRIDNLVLRETGGEVLKGQHLLDIYSEELIVAQEELLLALAAVERLGDSSYESVARSAQALLDAARQKCLRIGMTAEQLAELEVSRKVLDRIPIFASHSGLVMDKMVTEGMYVMEGDTLFSVADLSQVWVEVDIFESDAANLKIGDKVSMKCPVHPGMTFSGTVALIEPTLDSMTRTYRARVIVDNPELILRPGMIMDTQITVDHGEMLLLPRNAVLHTGDGDLVYVMAGENQWVPRRVTIGQDYGDQVQILSGLSPDEAVAGTAVFLLDSEAQLKGVPRPVGKAAQTNAGDANGGTDGGYNH